MKQEEIDKLMNEIDRKCNLPKHWDEFIEENSKRHNLIIKDKNVKNLYCTNCNKYFVNNDIKVRDYIECPHCHTMSIAYGMNYYRKSSEQPVVLVQRMNKKVIIRIFEIYSYFNKNSKQIKRSCIEFARIIPGIGRFIGNNVTYKELMLLQLFQKDDKNLIQRYRNTNINYLRYLIKNKVLDDFLKSGLQLSHTNINLIKEISKFVPIKKLMQYSKGLNNLHIYRDYLEMSKELALNYKSKKDLFPRNLIARHDKLQTRIKITEDMDTQFKAYLRYLELSKYTYDDDNYIIFPAPSIDDLKDEGKQQGNCVGYMYLKPYINRETEIFFIRKLDNITTSFITLEFKDGKVVQKELPHHNRDLTEEHLAFIEKWCQFRQFIDKKQKYQNRLENSSKQYDLKELVA